MNKITKQCLIHYVTEQSLQIEGIQPELIIAEFCAKQQPINITVYRGHDKNKNIRPNLWYSASKSERVAAEEFSGKDCCIFIIHLLNVPCIDINALIKDEIKEYHEEEEIIFLGDYPFETKGTGTKTKGTFYNSPELLEEGFRDLGSTNEYNKNKFECWYKIEIDKGKEEESKEEESKESKEESKESKEESKNEEKDVIQQALNIISEDEYDFITTPDDIFIDNFNLTQEEKHEIFDEIQRRKMMG